MAENHGTFSDLARQVSGELHADPLSRYLVSTDGSIFRVQPQCVVCPKNRDDVVKTVRFAGRHGIPVHARGAGSGLCGSAVGRGIVLDFTRHMNRLLSLDPVAGTFECEPGYRLGELEAQLKNTGLFFPPDPSSGEYATFGGMTATNAGGAHSVKYGSTGDYLADADVVLASGGTVRLSGIRNTDPGRLPDPFKALHRLYGTHREKIENAYPPVRFNSSGYNLRGMVRDDRLDLRPLFSGAEGTLGIATRLKFRLLKKPLHDCLVVALFDDILPSAEAVQQILPFMPAGIEIMDKSLMALARENDPALQNSIPADVDNVLMIEFDGPTPEACLEQARRTLQRLEAGALARSAHLAATNREKEKFWAIRKAAVPILYKLKGRRRILALIEDAAVPTDRLVEYFRGLYGILNRRRVRFVLYGHIAKGLIHTRPLLDLKHPHDLSLLKTLADEVFELVSALGGAISGEHGDGRLRTAYIRKQYPEIYHLFDRVKSLLDENNLLNPEIKTAGDPEQMAKDLRFGHTYRAVEPAETFLQWPGGFVAEIERCHGCSKCTTVTTATRMCPVYKFTRDEAASPKAKANALRAVISGALGPEHLYERTFRAVIDHCVNCGSCRTECPSNVDIPKMALEAKAHHVKRFGPTIEDRLTANIESAGRWLRKFSPVLKPAVSLDAARKAAERFSGLSARRALVLPAARSLFERVGRIQGEGDVRVLYFAGCYAGYIRPEIGQAAVRILNALDMKVHVPVQHCCGLPFISKGMAAGAAAGVRRNLKKWGDLIGHVDHIAVTCSSCGFSLLREWSYLTGDPAAASVRSKVIHISRLIDPYLNRATLIPSTEKAAYHMPCHLKIQADAESSLQLLSRMPGLQVENLDSHCCGMAGSWGMSAAHAGLSMEIGSDLAGKLRMSGAQTGVTDCPTCRIQMEQMGGLPVRHPVEIVADRLVG